LTSSDLSLFHLFWQAHWLVKTVMTGLMVCSVWVWAIAIDKTLPVLAHPPRHRPLRAGVLVGPVARGALYVARRQARPFDRRAVRRRHARMEKRSFEGHARSFAGLQMRIEKVMNVAIAREVEHMERGSWCWRRSARPGPLSACSAPSGAS
jgi:biopolymer transport protein TolQ